MYTHGTIQWNEEKLYLNDIQQPLEAQNNILDTVVHAYKSYCKPYPKFFKMDILSKAVTTAVSMLVENNGLNDAYLDQTATVVTTLDGCQDVDEKFEESRNEIPSPALFVYTLPNIMLGEICIKYKMKGEQICTIGDKTAALDMYAYIEDLFKHRNIKQAIVGYANAYKDNLSVHLALIKSDPNEEPFTKERYKKILSL